jgi:hypothetical protein
MDMLSSTCQLNLFSLTHIHVLDFTDDKIGVDEFAVFRIFRLHSASAIVSLRLPQLAIQLEKTTNSADIATLAIHLPLLLLRLTSLRDFGMDCNWVWTLSH